jgi:pimeloyl-ACP methyl ester carboxylesterase
VAFDAPGTGRSETPPLPLTITALAELAEQVLDRLGYEEVDVLGYSFGGIVAQHLARRAPQRVRRLLLVATTPGWGGVAGSVRTMLRMSTPLRYYSRSYYERTIGDLAGGGARTDRAWLERHGDERREHPPSPLGYMWQLAALTVPPGSLPWLHTLPQPTLVVAGDDDPIVPHVNSLLLAAAIPRARLLLARGEGHLLLLDPDSAAHPVMRAFIASEDLATSDARRHTVKVRPPMVDAALRASRPQLHAAGLLNAVTRAVYRDGARARAAQGGDW